MEVYLIMEIKFRSSRKTRKDRNFKSLKTWSKHLPTECEPVGGGVEGLGESDADQLVHEAGERGPAGVLVVAQAEQVDVPAVPQ